MRLFPGRPFAQQLFLEKALSKKTLNGPNSFCFRPYVATWACLVSEYRRQHPLRHGNFCARLVIRKPCAFDVSSTCSQDAPQFGRLAVAFNTRFPGASGFPGAAWTDFGDLGSSSCWTGPWPALGTQPTPLFEWWRRHLKKPGRPHPSRFAEDGNEAFGQSTEESERRHDPCVS